MPRGAPGLGRARLAIGAGALHIEAGLTETVWGA